MLVAGSGLVELVGWDLGDVLDVTASDCDKQSVDMLSIELARFLSVRGKLELELFEVDVEVSVGTVDDAAETGDVVDLVKPVMVAGLIVNVLLCCGRCCGRDMTLKDDGGGRSRIGVGMIRLSSGLPSAETDGGATSSGIINLRAGMMSSSSTSSGLGDTTGVTTTRFRMGKASRGEIERCGSVPRVAVAVLSLEGDVVSVSSGTDDVDRSLDIRRWLGLEKLRT